MVASDDRTAAAGGIGLLCLISTTVVWIVWFRRAYRNLPRLAGAELRFRPGWAIVSWFVPILNLFRPKQMANDVWRACDPAPQPGVAVEDRPVAPLLDLWWTAWIVAGFLGNLDGRRYFEAETIADQQDAAVIALVSDAGWLALTVVAVMVVRRMTDRYERRRELALTA